MLKYISLSLLLHSYCDDYGERIVFLIFFFRKHKLPCAFEEYVSKLNPNKDDFWQRPTDSFSFDDNVWYTNAPFGKNHCQALCPIFQM